MKADDLLTLPPAEQIDTCRRMAREMAGLAADAKGPELRTSYSYLANQWSLLANEIERDISVPVSRR